MRKCLIKYGLCFFLLFFLIQTSPTLASAVPDDYAANLPERFGPPILPKKKANMTWCVDNTCALSAANKFDNEFILSGLTKINGEEYRFLARFNENFELDPEFADRGVYLTQDYTGLRSSLNSSLNLQSKIIKLSDNSYLFASFAVVPRYRNDRAGNGKIVFQKFSNSGEPDNSFGNNSIKIITAPATAGSNDTRNLNLFLNSSVTNENDETYIMLTQLDNNVKKSFVAKLTKDVDLVSTFGNSGWLVLDQIDNVGNVVAHDLKLSADKQIFISGYHFASGGVRYWLLMKYNENGNLVNSFANSGVYIMPQSYRSEFDYSSQLLTRGSKLVLNDSLNRIYAAGLDIQDQVALSLKRDVTQADDGFQFGAFKASDTHTNTLGVNNASNENTYITNFYDLAVDDLGNAYTCAVEHAWPYRNSAGQSVSYLGGARPFIARFLSNGDLDTEFLEKFRTDFRRYTLSNELFYTFVNDQNELLVIGSMASGPERPRLFMLKIDSSGEIHKRFDFPVYE